MQEMKNIRPKPLSSSSLLQGGKPEVLGLKVKLDLQAHKEFSDKQQGLAETSLLQVNPFYQQFACS